MKIYLNVVFTSNPLFVYCFPFMYFFFTVFLCIFFILRFFYLTWPCASSDLCKKFHQVCNLVLRIFEFRFSSNYTRIHSFMVFRTCFRFFFAIFLPLDSHSLSLCLSLSLYPSVSLSLCVSLSLSVNSWTCFRNFLSISLSPTFFLFLSFSLCPSHLSLSVFLPDYAWNPSL